MWIVQKWTAMGMLRSEAAEFGILGGLRDLDPADLRGIAVAVAHADLDGIAPAVSQQGLAQRGLHADQAVDGVLAHGADDRVGLLLVIFGKIDGDGLADPDLILRRGVLDDRGCLDHPLQEADPALIAILLPLGRVVLEVLTQIPVCPGLLDVLQEPGTDDQLAVLDLFFHLCNIIFGQFVVHIYDPPCGRIIPVRKAAFFYKKTSGADRSAPVSVFLYG